METSTERLCAVKLIRLLESLVGSVHNAPDGRERTGFNSPWWRNFLSVHSSSTFPAQTLCK